MAPSGSTSKSASKSRPRYVVKGAELGSGSNCTVTEYTDDKGRVFAVKVGNDVERESKNFGKLRRAMGSDSWERHNIIRFYGKKLLGPDQKPALFLARHRCSLAMMIENDPACRCSHTEPFEPDMYPTTHPDLLTLARDMSNALAFVHAAGLVHLDVKPDNILAEKEDEYAPLRFLLSDFGSAIEIPTKKGDYFLGNHQLLAPEAIPEMSRPDGKVDMWALGVSMMHYCRDICHECDWVWQGWGDFLWKLHNHNIIIHTDNPVYYALYTESEDPRKQALVCTHRVAVLALWEGLPWYVRCLLAHDPAHRMSSAEYREALWKMSDDGSQKLVDQMSQLNVGGGQSSGSSNAGGKAAPKPQGQKTDGKKTQNNGRGEAAKNTAKKGKEKSKR